MFGKKYDKEKLNDTIKKSSFIDIMKRNKLDMKTPLMSYYQDHAKDLSMGESQLLFLARCLYKNTNMMIWDEPSSNLDPFKELDLFKKYKDLAKDSMGIFISHKASNIEMFDEIIYMEEGKIVEKGSFKDLMEIKGKYYELYKKQKEIFEY